MKISQNLFFIFLIFAVFIGCKDDNIIEPNAPKFNVGGRVTTISLFDSNPYPIDSVKVTLGEISVYTNSSGYFSFDSLINGEYTISLTTVEYNTVEDTINILDSDFLGDYVMTPRHFLPLKVGNYWDYNEYWNNNNGTTRVTIISTELADNGSIAYVFDQPPFRNQHNIFYYSENKLFGYSQNNRVPYLFFDEKEWDIENNGWYVDVPEGTYPPGRYKVLFRGWGSGHEIQLVRGIGLVFSYNSSYTLRYRKLISYFVNSGK